MTTKTVERCDPLVISWLLKCDSDQSDRIRSLLRAETSPDAEIVDTVSAVSNGRESPESQSHRIGDYFKDIQLFSEPSNDACVLRVTFHRRPDAGRFWKDVMMRILDAARRAGAQVEFASDAG